MNNTDLKQLAKLLKYSDKYELSIQFWPTLTSVYIAKDGVELQNFGGDDDFAINESVKYLNRINKNGK